MNVSSSFAGLNSLIMFGGKLILSWPVLQIEVIMHASVSGVLICMVLNLATFTIRDVSSQVQYCLPLYLVLKDSFIIGFIQYVSVMPILM